MILTAIRFALRRLRRGWRSGELLILTLALAVAVAAVSAVTVFTERVRQAMAEQSGDTLGADLVFTSRDPLPESLLAAVEGSGSRSAATVQFPSVVLHGEATALAAVKAVAAGYPLRGQLRVADQPFGPARLAPGVPPHGEAWVDQRLWQDLGLSIGASVQAGSAQFRISALIENEPDRGNGFTDLAPRILINLDDLRATGLLSPGARAQFSLMVAGAPDALAPLRKLDLAKGVRRVTPEDSRPEIRAALKSAGQFLDIAVLAATLLAAAALALCAHQHGARLRDEVALLKCLGARQNFLVVALLLNLLLLGAAGGAAGALVGVAAQEVIARLLGGLMQLQLPPARFAPVWIAWGLGLLMLLGFGAPPVLQARRVPPVRVFQRDAGEAGLSRLVSLAAAGTVMALLWLQTGEPKLATAVLIGAGATVGVLALMAWGLVLLLAPLKRAVGTSWRFGLGNVARRRGATVAQTVALGLALMALLLVSVVRQDLLSTWRARLPPQTPNQFLINIQPAQVEPVKAFFAQRGYADLKLWPMARGRLTALRGKPVDAQTFDDPETQRWINRDFNLSWTDTLNPDNKITQGAWWGPAGRGHAWLSADEYAVERLGLKLGDTLTLDFAGTPVEFTVHNLRSVEWDSFKPNFFLLAPPGVVDEQASAQFLTSFYLPAERRALLRELVGAFPNVTAFDIESAMKQVRSIMDRIVGAVEFIFLFTLAAGATVLLAAIEGTRSDRIRETALLRTLGARTGTIARGLIAEYAVLGLLAGVVAAFAAQGVAWVLAVQVFKIPYGPRPLLWLAGAASGCGLVTLLGWLSLRKVLRTPPRLVLQGNL
ncbi:MAG TPA: FtsX-like permease family protein [Solimonas sp.]|nr:FtsX-like permease family protein [Solimonas sp.]